MGQGSNRRTTDGLHRRSEATLSGMRAVPSQDNLLADSQPLSHELHTHQIELEMQNEEFLRVKPELTEACDRCAEIYDFAPVGYATISDKGIILDANMTLAGMLGVDHSSLIGQRFTRFIAPTEADDWYLFAAHLLKHNKRQRYELALERADSSQRTVQLLCLPMPMAGYTAIRAAFTDISDLKKAETNLNRYALQSSDLFEHMIDIYYKVDMDGRIVDVSPSCLAQSGYSQEELIGHSTAKIYADQTQRQAMLSVLLERGHVNDYEIEMLHKDGTSIFTSVTAHILMNQDRRPIGREGILRNITQRKQAEQARDTLIHENRALMRQIMQVQEDERHILSRTLHDELGQLLTSIDARAEYIVRHTESDDLRGVAEEIVRDTRASFDASHAMLLRLRPATLDSLGLAAALTELCDQWQKQADINCILRIDGEIDHLSEMHAIVIYRLVQEGLTNVHRHAKATRVEVSIRNVPSHSGQAGQVQIEIHDNGKGMHGQTVVTGMGVIGMRERVHALGGTFLMEHVPPDGVRIEVMLPVDGREVSDDRC